MNKKVTDVIVVGFALFAMFLGAGNVIFPPYLGHASGSEWLPAMIGFLLTGVGLPLLGIIAVAKAGGTVDHLAKNVSNNFGKIFGTIIVLTIGPMLAIPRTGATAYELGVAPFFWRNYHNLYYNNSCIFWNHIIFFIESVYCDRSDW
nr:branched-chain amino acid transport system II carrier protein [Natranaerobius trueperi]